MANDLQITVVGNLTADPELRYTQQGLAVANFTIAQTPRVLDRATNEWKDEEATFLRSSIWREPAEHVAASLVKGQPVIATGILKTRSYETKEGEKRSAIEFHISDIGPSLRYGTTAYTKVAKGDSAGVAAAAGAAAAPAAAAPAAAAPAAAAPAAAPRKAAPAVVAVADDDDDVDF